MKKKKRKRPRVKKRRLLSKVVKKFPLLSLLDPKVDIFKIPTFDEDVDAEIFQDPSKRKSASAIEIARKDAAKAKPKKAAGSKSLVEMHEYRVKMSEKVEKYFVGEFAIPTADMKRPPHTTANRSFNESHAAALTATMWRVGLTYPFKPCVVAAFNVNIFLFLQFVLG